MWIVAYRIISRRYLVCQEYQSPARQVEEVRVDDRAEYRQHDREGNRGAIEEDEADEGRNMYTPWRR